MRLTRHARNRIRRIQRRYPEVTPAHVLEALLGAETLRYDEAGNKVVRVVLGEANLSVVASEADRVVITIWEE